MHSLNLRSARVLGWGAGHHWASDNWLFGLLGLFPEGPGSQHTVSGRRGKKRYLLAPKLIGRRFAPQASISLHLLFSLTYCGFLKHRGQGSCEVGAIWDATWSWQCPQTAGFCSGSRVEQASKGVQRFGVVFKWYLRGVYTSNKVSRDNWAFNTEVDGNTSASVSDSNHHTVTPPGECQILYCF